MNDSRYAHTIPKSLFNNSWRALGRSPRNSPMMGGRYEDPIKCAYVQQTNAPRRCIKTDGEHDHVRCEVNDKTSRCRLVQSKPQAKPQVKPQAKPQAKQQSAKPLTWSPVESEAVPETTSPVAPFVDAVHTLPAWHVLPSWLGRPRGPETQSSDSIEFQKAFDELAKKEILGYQRRYWVQTWDEAEWDELGRFEYNPHYVSRATHGHSGLLNDPYLQAKDIIRWYFNILHEGAWKSMQYERGW